MIFCSEGWSKGLEAGRRELLGWVLNYLLRRPPCNSLSITIMNIRMKRIMFFWDDFDLIVCTLPSMRRSWPWLPMRVFERKGAKSIMISLRRGQTVPRATWGKVDDINWTFWFCRCSYSNVVKDIHLQLLSEHCLSTRSWYGQRPLVDKRFDVELVRPRLWWARTHSLEIARGLQDSYVTLRTECVGNLYVKTCFLSHLNPVTADVLCLVMG